MNRLYKPLRAAILTALPLLLGCVCILSLYNLQIRKKNSLAADTPNIRYSYTTVPAARGDITDRYGRVLISDGVGYAITIDRLLLTASDTPNEALLTLVDCVSSFGVAYTDTLPVSTDAPFEYTEMDSRQSIYLSDYKDHFELDDINADELMTYFRKHYSIPESFTDREARIAAGIRYELELRALFNTTQYIFAREPDVDLISAVSEKNLPGVSIINISVRKYYTDSAAHVLGRTGLMSAEEYEYYSTLGYPMNAVVGKDGAEKAFESYLHGTNGQLVTKYTNGELSDEYYTVEPKAGGTVALTLDIYLQQAVEDALVSKIDKINADRLSALEDGEEFVPAQVGAVVVIEVGTGDVLALASYPDYNLEDFSANSASLLNDPLSPMFNRATQGRYAPGSTFKMVTGTAGLQEGAITTETKIYDKGIIDEYEGYSYRCWAYPGSHGSIDIREALQYSCNYFFYTVGKSIGIDAIDKYATAYGLGQPTGIELYENTGILASRDYKKENLGESWYTGDTLQASIGQSYNLFTPLQLASYAATIASGGQRWATHLLKSVSSHDLSIPLYHYNPQLLSTVDADEDCFAALAEGMNMAAKYGSASYVFYNYPVEVCSKTGTAQVAEDTVNNAVFIAFAPYENPEIAVAVVVEKGSAGYYLAEVARDIFDHWFAASKEYLLPPENLLIP